MSLAPMTQATSVVGEFVVDLVHFEDDVVRDIRLGEQDVHVAGQASGDGVDGEFDLDAAFFEDLADLGERVLCLCDREAVAGNDDDLFGVEQQVGRTGCIDDRDLACRFDAGCYWLLPLSVPNPPSITLTNERFMPLHMM